MEGTCSTAIFFDLASSMPWRVDVFRIFQGWHLHYSPCLKPRRKILRNLRYFEKTLAMKLPWNMVHYPPYSNKRNKTPSMPTWCYLPQDSIASREQIHRQVSSCKRHNIVGGTIYQRAFLSQHCLPILRHVGAKMVVFH